MTSIKPETKKTKMINSSNYGLYESLGPISEGVPYLGHGHHSIILGQINDFYTLGGSP
jgi:hypothetical protein